MLQTYKQETLIPSSSGAINTLESLLPLERARLVRLCARLTSNVDAAEDLAQETLLEAWKNLHKLQGQADPSQQAKWLSAIARNVCMRWTSKRGRDLAHLVSLDQDEEAPETGIESLTTDTHDIEIELERDELALLLDRALALLPAGTRDVLIARYIHESPHAEIAARLGLSEGALVQRLHRGKLALRRVITTHMSMEAEAYGMAVPAEEKLQQETRIWCPMCGGLVIAQVGSHIVPARLFGICLFVFGFIDLLIVNVPAFIPGLLIVLILFVIVGLPATGVRVSLNALLQITVDDRLRGRIFGTNFAVYGLMVLISMILAGTLGDRLGPVLLLNIQGGMHVLSGIFALLTLGAVKAPGHQQEEQAEERALSSN